MKAAHAHLEIKNIHFDMIVNFLGKALMDKGMEKGDVEAVASKLEGLRGDIVTLDD